MTTTTLERVDDLIDHLVGTTPGSALDRLRRARPATRTNAEATYAALFQPADTRHVSLSERIAIAAFVTGLHGVAPIEDFYAAELVKLDRKLAATLAREIAAGLASGPYGRFPPGPLSSEDQPGMRFRTSPAARAFFGEHLATGLDHAHLLVFHPRDADPAALKALTSAGWTATGIVTLSQIVAFLSFQIRVVAGLKALAG